MKLRPRGQLTHKGTTPAGTWCSLLHPLSSIYKIGVRGCHLPGQQQCSASRKGSRKENPKFLSSWL